MAVDPDLELIAVWLKEQQTTADLVEDAYKIYRGSHRGELPKYMRSAWHDAPAAYRQFLVFLAKHAIDAQTNK